MWGQASRSKRLREKRGIIPTRVGTSRRITLRKPKDEDHPHACGDKNWLFSCCITQDGSSPRVWGQDSFAVFLTFSTGIIPTRVGTSYTRYKSIGDERDHPHACGDKAEKMSKIAPIIGSSPRVWGQAMLKISFLSHLRIIPTRVGTSLVFLSPVALLWDHPHACGDKPTRLR